MNLENLKRRYSAHGSLVLLVYFLLQTSCGQDPAFNETTFLGGGDAVPGDDSSSSADAQPILTGSDPDSIDGGSEKDGASGTESDGPETIEEIIEACDQYEKHIVTQTLVFPERQDCRWNENGNGPRLNTFMQARESQIDTMNNVTNGVFCNLEIESTLSNLHYDDFLFFTLGDFILIGSNSHFVEQMPQENGVYSWDWEAIKGLPWQQTDPYCIEGSDSCTVPPHDVPGSINVTLNSEAVSQLALKLKDSEELPFKLIATGDNDDGDCFHSEMSLEVQMEYVKLPSD